jgi:asparagine synthase (glutamine-hydrolysing)
MPGFAAIITGKNSPDCSGRIEQMAGRMVHGPGYTSGTYCDHAAGIFAGWATIKSSFSDCLPIWNEKRDVCLILCGEDFTETSALDDLKRAGHTFDPERAGYIVHLYEELGPAFVRKLNGWFGGLLIDFPQQKAMLFNDRYGLSRVHVHENAGAFYCATEAKALLSVLPGTRALDMRSLGEFFSLSAILENRTLFKGISLLPPASLWTFAADGKITKETYFDVREWERQSQLPLPDYYDAIKDTWARLLPRYLRGNDKVALSLTGGVDSRMILAWANRQGGIPCYTFGGRYRDCADVKISRQVAQICRQPHHTIPVSTQFLERFPQLAEKTVYLSDGTMDVTGAIDLYIQQGAREIAPVRVTGTNGGEILRTLVAFKPISLREEIFDPSLLESYRGAAATYRSESDGHKLTFTAFKQAPWYMCSKFVVERSQVTLRMPYFDNDLVSLVYRAPAEALQSNDLSLRLIADGNPALAAIGTDRGIRHSPIPGVTQARHCFQEFTFKAEYAYDYGMPQWLAKIDHAFAPLRLERLFLGRHKFHHFRVFYRDELSAYVKDLLLSPAAATRNYLSRPAVEKIVKGHVKGDSNYTLELHKLLSAELIHRTLLSAN